MLLWLLLVFSDLLDNQIIVGHFNVLEFGLIVYVNATCSFLLDFTITD